MRGFAILLAFIASIAAGHAAVLLFAPGFIMGKAMTATEQRDIPTHAFRLADRMTPQTQTVVRPSPDLAYSLCLFDFTDGVEAIEIEAAAYGNYASVSLYDEQTDNFATLRGDGRGDGEPIALRLLPPGTDTVDDSITAPSRKGIVLIRRLAPTEAAYREVAAIAVKDSCRAVAKGGDTE